MKYIYLLLALAIFTAACTSTDYEIDSEPVNIEIPAENNANVIEIDMVAKQFEFIPEVVTVNEGDTVRLNIESIDVDHGISIPDFGVNVQLDAGKTTTVEFIANKKGEFTFVCSVFCGIDHGLMKGTLVVE